MAKRPKEAERRTLQDTQIGDNRKDTMTCRPLEAVTVMAKEEASLIISKETDSVATSKLVVALETSN
jgi:hypothetical protein